MQIDPRVFLSRPSDVHVDGAVKLSDALAEASSAADKIIILSAYFGSDYLASVFAAMPKRIRKACSLSLVFGFESAAKLPHAIEELRCLRQKLIELGFPAPSVKVFRKNAPFHVKLYFFKNATQPVWFVGSANASPAINGGRHELMVRLRGRHPQLSHYAAGVIASSVDVEKVDLGTEIVSDLRSFFLNGSLCYRPLSRLTFTFEACKIDGEHRRVLRDSLAAVSKVPHADPQTEGFGFNLTTAVGQTTGEQFASLVDEEMKTDKSVSRLKFRHMAIETIYGYWLPAAYADEVRSKLDLIEKRSIDRLKFFAKRLEAAPLATLEAELDSHLQGLKAFFAGHTVEIEPRADYKSRFRDFVKTRKSLLADESRLEHSVRRLHVEPMPDIWIDQNAVTKFESSFFEDLALRFDAPGRSWIVGVLRDELELRGGLSPDEIRSALETRLKSGFSDTIWWGEQAGEVED